MSYYEKYLKYKLNYIDLHKTENLDSKQYIYNQYGGKISFDSLKIGLEDLVNENFQNTEHVISIKYGDWNSLKNFVSESEVENIKNIFEESLEDIKEFDDNDIEYCSQIYISALYCNEEFVWEGTTF